MASPYYFKSGWDREKLAEYILSRFCFVAKPSTVSDDLGTDLFCTLFLIEEKNGIDYPLPLSSFAIQIKSSDKPFDFSANINYLKKLEIPFFLGVVNESVKELSIFSGENLPKFFPHVGPLSKLRIKPIERSHMNAPYDPMEGRKKNYTIMFPKLMTIGIDSTKEDLEETVQELRDLCSMIHGNISTVKMHEYIFEEYDKITYSILAGPGSYQKFRDNFMKRLAENFYNLEWYYNQCNKEKKEELLKEFRIYEDIYFKIKKLYPSIHGVLIKQYEMLQEQIVKKTEPTKKPKAKAVKKAHSKKVAHRKAVPKKATQATATEKVFAIIKRSKKGVGTVTLMEKTGYNQKKISNLVFKLRKQGKIKSVNKGVYVKA